MLHSFRRFATISVAVISAVVAPALVATAPAAHAAAGLTNCVDLTRVAACYELVWVDGVQFRMTFPQAANPMPAIPTAKVQNFYVIAPQTGTPQGAVPGFNHDHVIAASPTHSAGGFTVFMHGYFVVCSAPGIASGACAPILSTIPGDGTIPLAQTVNGQALTSTSAIEAGAGSGALLLIDTGAEFIGTLSPR